jgi:hypothetical protein
VSIDSAAIVLEPEGQTLGIGLKGDLAAMLAAAQNAKRPPETGDLQCAERTIATISVLRERVACRLRSSIA